MATKIFFTVINELCYDQRMKRICDSLTSAGYHVTLIGRKVQTPLPLPSSSYKQIRLTCFFGKGKLMYFEFNLRLFLHLLFHRRPQIICACDIDTIIPCYYFSKIKKVKRVLDAHEYFSELFSIASRKMVKKIWTSVEKKYVPLYPDGYTVSDYIAQDFSRLYQVKYEVIRNMPALKKISTTMDQKQYIIYQGSILPGRYLDLLTEAMQQISIPLIICGGGPYFSKLLNLIKEKHLEKKIILKGFVLPAELIHYTENAYIGINLNAGQGLSHQYSLSNRFFDYMHAGIPQLCSDFPAYRDINNEYEIAILLNHVSKDTIAAGLNDLLCNAALYNKLKQNCLAAREKYCWQNEEKKLIDLYAKLNPAS